MLGEITYPFPNFNGYTRFKFRNEWIISFHILMGTWLVTHADIKGSPSQIARFMWPTCGPPGSCRPQVGPMLAPLTLLSGMLLKGDSWRLSPHIFIVNSLYIYDHIQSPKCCLLWDYFNNMSVSRNIVKNSNSIIRFFAICQYDYIVIIHNNVNSPTSRCNELEMVAMMKGYSVAWETLMAWISLRHQSRGVSVNNLNNAIWSGSSQNVVIRNLFGCEWFWFRLYLVSTLPVNGLAPLGTRASAGTVMTKHERIQNH